MKDILCVLFMIMTSAPIWAEDTILLRDGRAIKAVIQEVSQTEVKYKRASNPSGPLFTINISDIKSISYDNGEIDEFSTIVESEYGPAPKEENVQLINKYHTDIIGYEGKNSSSKKAKGGIMTFDLTKESILKDANITIEICPKDLYEIEKRSLGEYIWDGSTKMFPEYRILVHNNSDKIVYIDLGNTFRIYGDQRVRSHCNDGDGTRPAYYNNDWTDNPFRIYYKSDVYSTNSSSTSSIAIGLGSVASTLGIGGKIGNLMQGLSYSNGSEQGASHTQINERILQVPPHSTIELPPYQVLIDKKYYNNYDYFYCGFSYDEIPVSRWEVMNFREDVSPYNESFIITYSTDQNFSHFSNIKFSLYCSSIIGTDNDMIEPSWQPKKILGIHEHSIIGACRIY